MSFSDGQTVIYWMNRAYAVAEQGQPEHTFLYWEQAYQVAGPNERNWLEKVERRPLMNRAYEQSARRLLEYAHFMYEREKYESTKEAPFHFHEMRREEVVKLWAETIIQARDHASECNNHTLLTSIQETRKNPVRSLWRTRIRKLLFK